MSSKTVIVKNGFLDREHDHKRRKPGELLRVSPDRARELINKGFAVASTEEEAEEIKKPLTVGVSTSPQWAEPKEVKPVKKAAKKK